MERPITRVSLSTPDIADALVTTPYEFLVHGKMPGTISMLVWGDNGRIKSYDIAVKRDLSSLEAQIRRLFPGEAITATSNGKDVVLVRRGVQQIHRRSRLVACGGLRRKARERRQPASPAGEASRRTR